MMIMMKKFRLWPLAMLLVLLITACQPYLTTADTLAITRVNNALNQMRDINSLSVTMTADIQQEMNTSAMGQSIRFNTAVTMSGGGNSARNASGGYDFAFDMQADLNLRSNERALGNINEQLDYGVVLVDNVFFTRMAGSGLLGDASTNNQWIYADINDLLAGLPAGSLNIMSIFGVETLDSYPLTQNTVQSVQRPAATVVNGVRVDGYRFEVDMLAVLDEIGFEEVLRQLGALGELGDLSELEDMDELGEIFGTGANFDLVTFINNIARDFYKGSRTVITVWLDDADIIHRVDVDMTLRADVSLMGIRLRLNQTSRESVTYGAFNQPVTINRPL